MNKIKSLHALISIETRFIDKGTITFKLIVLFNANEIKPF